MFTMRLERNRSDHDRFVTLIKYESTFMDDGRVVVTPWRYTWIVGRGGLICERITRLKWEQIKRESYSRAPQLEAA